MTDKQPVVFTFHLVREQCEQGSADAWRAFLDFYSPLFLHLLEIDGFGDTPVWERTLDALVDDNYQRFRATSRQSEREFLIDVRALLVDQALAEARKSAGAEASGGGGAPVLNLGRVAQLVEGLPLLHQEILWFKLRGYTDATIERILRMAPGVAHAALDRLMPDFAAARDLTSDRCPWPGDWLALLHQARANKKDDCPPLHQLMRIQDGQVSWYDKEPVEKRVASCLHCLESWTGLREVGYWRRAAPAVSPEQIEQLRRRIPTVEPEKRSLLKRVFG